VNPLFHFDTICQINERKKHVMISVY